MQKLFTALAKATEDVHLMEETVAEATDLFAEGKLEQENLDRALQDRDRAIARKASLEERIEAAKSKAQADDIELQKAQRKAAAQRTRNVLKQRADCAADLDSNINALVDTLKRMLSLNEQTNLAAYEAGVDANRRNHLLSLRPAGAALASSLRRTNLADGLVFVTVAHTFATAQSASEMVEAENAKIAATLGAE